MTGSVLRAAIYARVSTGRQAAGDKTSIPDQLRRCRAVVAQEGWELAGEYVDPGVSGEKLEERPELVRLLGAASGGLLDVVVAIDLDRLARDEFVFASIFQELDRAEVAVHADGTLYDGENLSQRLMRGIKSQVSAHDRRALVRKMATGQRARGRAGGWPGGAPPYGYRLVWPESQGSGKPLARVETDPHEREMLEVAIAAIVDEGLSTGEACERLEVLGYRTRGGVARHEKRQPQSWTHQNLRRVLASRALLGELAWGKPTGRGDHRTRVRRDGSPYYGDTVEMQLPPLITEERFVALQAALNRRSYGTKRPDHSYPCSGAHAACGGQYGGVYRRDRDLRQYRCNRAKWNAARNPRCGCARLDADWLDGVVWGEVVALLSDPARLLELADEYLGLRAGQAEAETGRIARLDRQIAELEQSRVRSATEYIRAGLDPALVAEAVGKLEEELATARGERERLEAVRVDQQAAQARAVQLARLAERAGARLPEMALEQQAEVLELLAVRVTALDGSSRPALLIEGEVPGGGDPFNPDPGNPDCLPLRSPVAGVTIPFQLRKPLAKTPARSGFR